TPFAVRDGDGHARAFHTGEENRRRLRDFDEAQARFELLRTIADEARPAIRAGNELAQRRHHLAAVADTERERIGALEKAGELLAQLSIEKDRLRPSLARAEHIAVREPAARDEAAKIGETSATRDEIGHVDVVRFEARAVERRRHLDLTVHALLAQ